MSENEPKLGPSPIRELLRLLDMRDRVDRYLDALTKHYTDRFLEKWEDAKK